MNLSSIGTVVVVAVIGFPGGCGTPVPAEACSSDCPPRPIIDCPAKPGDSIVGIDSATVAGDRLDLQVKFGGGCAAHTFDLCWDHQTYLTQPAQVDLVLVHHNGGDGCEALLTREVAFDLSSLKGSCSNGGAAGTCTLLLNISGGPSGVRYDF